ncbi:hypothetical protein [Streptomyces sp. NPDC049040]|uniref:hypothetical protein n=1 Tax=Streptomyces sp. NPDC049040 TaxID=3365593 RepID=UPI00371FB0A0
MGYVCAYLVRKARGAAGAADAEVDRAVEAGMGRVHDLVSRALGDDPALEQADRQAPGGEEAISERTRRRLTDALDDALDADPELRSALEQAVADLREAEGGAGTVTATGDGIAVGGNVELKADHGSAAALRMGNVTLGNPPPPGTRQG